MSKTGLRKSDRWKLKCLVCYEEIKIKPKRKSKSGSCNSKSCESPIEDQLNAVFILKVLLELPSEQLEQFLSLGGGNGGNPKDWIHFCSKCQVSLERSLEIRREVTKLSKDLQSIKKLIVGRIKDSFVDNAFRKEEANPGSITSQSRAFVWRRDYGDFRTRIVFENPERTQNQLQLVPSHVKVESEVQFPHEGPEDDHGVSSQDQDFPSLSDNGDDAASNENEDNASAEESEFEEEKVLSGRYHTVTSLGNFMCVKCKRSCSTMEDLKAHIKLHKSGQNNCAACHRVFPSKLGLREHMLRVHLSKMDLDQTCRKRRWKFAELKSFILNAGKEPEPFQLPHESGSQQATATGSLPESKRCPTCPKRFTSAIAVCEHLANGKCAGLNTGPTPSATLSCAKCKMFQTPISNVGGFGEHLMVCGEDIQKKSLEQRLFPCRVCPKIKYFKVDNFIQHYQDHSVFVWQCTDCPKRFISSSLIQNHWRHCHPDRRAEVPIPNRFKKVDPGAVPEVPWWCQICSTAPPFHSEQERDQHMIDSHQGSDIPEKLISCPHCPNKYVSEDELKLHQGVAHIAKNLRLKRVLPCDICEELFWRDSGLERHKRRVHRVNLVVCEVCGLEFLTEHILRTHKEQHQLVKSFQCDECDKTFVVRKYLKEHKLRDHAPPDPSVNPLACRYCGKVYSYSHLQYHIATVHEKKKKMKFNCHLCDFGDPLESSLRKHLVTKHKVGGFKCTVEGCGKILLCQQNLKDHLDQHEGTPQHICELCGKDYRLFEGGNICST